MLDRAIEALHAGNPDVDVVLGGMLYPDLEWLEAVCDDGGRPARPGDPVSRAFGTVARLAALLGEQPITWKAPSLASSSIPAGEIYRHLFTRADGRQALFLWVHDRSALVDVRLGQRETTAIEFALDGTPVRRLPVIDGVLSNLTLQAGEVRFFEIS